jgi:hypothetical protein
MKKIITILLIMVAIPCMAQDLQKAYEEYCTEGVEYKVDSVKQKGVINVQIYFDSNGDLKHGNRDTVWYDHGLPQIVNGYVMPEYSYTGSLSFTGGIVDYWTDATVTISPPKKRHISTTYSVIKSYIQISISRWVYTEYYHEKKEKQSFESWLKTKNYLK